jgi:hypothetical protein
MCIQQRIAASGNAINEEAIEYYNSFDPDVDSVEYADGFLFAFQEAIDGKQIERYELALEGNFDIM